MRIFAIDPGTTESGWVLLQDGPLPVEPGRVCWAHRHVLDSGVSDNHDVLRWVQAGQGAEVLAIEMFANMGMAVGASTFTTVRWIGRFQQAWREPEAVQLIPRMDVKLKLCGSSRAKDSNVRMALIDLIGAPGTKGAAGPTYGVKSHAWQALGVAVTAQSLLAAF